MRDHVTRRKFLAGSVTASAAVLWQSDPRPAPAAPATRAAPLRIGLMTYRLGETWDLGTLIKHCRATKFEHAELRTTHGHGVEVSLSKTQRNTVRAKFRDAGLALSLASAFSYHWPDAAKLRANIEGTKQYTLLARDIGARGIRVFPNALLVDEGIPEEKTLAQIGRALAEVGKFAADHGVEIRVSNHGRGTNRIQVTKRILDCADSKDVYVNWNCDKSDVEAPGFEANFNLVKDRIRNIHMHELWNEEYPYRKLFSLLQASGYQGYCDAEVPPSCEPLRLMRYYRGLFLALQDAL